MREGFSWHLWPSGTDDLDRLDTDPPGWHVREKTDDGYPLMGSSPAERQENRERAARIKAQAMRTHPFEGSGVYCQFREGPSTSGGPATGVLTMWVQCGYPRDMHPEDRQAGLTVPDPDGARHTSPHQGVC